MGLLPNVVAAGVAAVVVVVVVVWPGHPTKSHRPEGRRGGRGGDHIAWPLIEWVLAPSERRGEEALSLFLPLFALLLHLLRSNH